MPPDPLRRSVRFKSDHELGIVERSAAIAGVAVGALIRECALRWGPVLAAEAAAGRVKVSGKPSRVRAVKPQVESSPIVRGS